MLYGAEKRRRDRVWEGDIVWDKRTSKWALVTEVNQGNMCLDFPPAPGSTTWSMYYGSFNTVLLEPEARLEAAMKGFELPPVPEFPEHAFQQFFEKHNAQRAEREGLQLVLATQRIC